MRVNIKFVVIKYNNRQNRDNFFQLIETEGDMLLVPKYIDENIDTLTSISNLNKFIHSTHKKDLDALRIYFICG